jgi:hypothetical protein
MIVVSEILDDVADALGLCADDTPVIFRRLTRAARLLAPKGEWDPLQGEVTIAVEGRCFALPADVETVLSVNIDGRPAVGRDRYFDYHLNGPGEVSGDRLEWRDRGSYPTFFDLPSPCRIGYIYRLAADSGSNKSISIYGNDTNGVPTESLNMPPNGAGYSFGSKIFGSISRISKPVSADVVEIKAYPVDGSPAFTIAILQGRHTESAFRRLEIGITATAVRVAYRRKVYTITSVTDVIPLHSEMALITAVKAVDRYLKDDPELGAVYEAAATRMLSEQERASAPPVGMPLQVSGVNGFYDASDDVS